MLRRFLSALALFGLFFPAVCKADPVDYSYSFGFSPNPPTLAANPGTGSVTFSLFGGGAISTTTGTVTGLQAASLFTTSSAQGTVDSPADSFSSPYKLTVTVHDTASNQSFDFGFDGHLGGTLTAAESHVTATFTGPLSVSHDLGGFTYTVSVEPEVANLPIPGSLADVLLNANVVAALKTSDTGSGGPVTDPGTGPGTDPGTANAPEPGTLVLGLVAGAGVMLARRRRQAA